MARSVGNAAAHVIEQAQQADPVSFPDFRGSLQAFDEIKGQEAVAPNRELSQALCVGPEAVRTTRPSPLILFSSASTESRERARAST
jgi:hypothetical protein